MLQVCMLVFAGVFAALILKKDKQEYAVLIIIIVSIFIALKVLGILNESLIQIETWEELLNGNWVYIKLLLKLIGITYLCEFASNICKDAGYSALSNHIELFGKVAIMTAGLPIIKTMLKLLEDILS